MEKIDAEDENRLWEESEAKRRAEFAKRIKEEAEASAKRRAEEDRLWEEAWAKRKAEVEKRLREEAEAKKRIEENKEHNEPRETRAKRIAKEHKINKEKAEAAASRMAEEEKRRKEAAALARRKAEDEKRLSKEEGKKRKMEAANQLKLEVEDHRKYKEEPKISREAKNNRNVQAPNRPSPITENNVKTEEANERKNIGLKKGLMVGSAVVVLGIIIIWAFSLFSGDSEDLPALQNIQETEVEEPEVLEKTNNDSLNSVAAFSKLGVGDLYEGGFVFAIYHSSNTGKIAHIDDAGPMPWQNAIKIHEQLGEGWRLPTFDELQTMYRTIGPGATNIGEFSNGLYWSATDFDEYQARLLRFSDGNTTYHYNKNVEHRQFRVRAIRDISL